MFGKLGRTVAKLVSFRSRSPRPEKKAASHPSLLRAQDPVGSLHDWMETATDGFSVAHGFAECPESRLLGLSLKARVAAKRDLYPFVADLLAQVPMPMVARYNTRAGAAAFSRERPEKFRLLVDTILDERPPLETGAITEVRHGLLSLGDWERDGRIEAAYRSTIETQHTPYFASITHWLRKRRTFTPGKTSAAAITMGILSYRNPGLASSNIGDQIQSIAMIGQMIAAGARPAESSNPFCSTAFARFGSHLRSRPGTPVELLIVDRDDISTPVTDQPMWLPIFGWFGHAKFQRLYDLNIPANIRPLFISLHIAREDVISSENMQVLKRYEPIGCRDYTTVRILRAAGIRAFFSGCVTSTLGTLYPREGRRQGHYAAGYCRKRLKKPRRHVFVAHELPMIRDMHFDETLQLADGILAKYSTASSVHTNLLHCYMPCRGMGTPVKFVHPKSGNRRFEGLIGASDAEIDAMKRRFAKLKDVFALIYSGASETMVYELWRETWIEEERATTDYLSATIPALSDGRPLVETAIREATRHTLSAPHPEGVSVCLAVDRNMLAPLRTTIRSLVQTSSLPVNIYVLCRNIAPSEVRACLEGIICHGLVHVDCSNIEYGSTLELLNHTTVSTMDRLLIPALLPDVPKVIYLDVDILVRRDIATLWGLDMGDRPIAARVSIQKAWRRGLSLSLDISDKQSKDNARSLRAFIASDGPTDWTCFNAGVLVMDLERLRAMNAPARALPIAGMWGLHDQFVLNLIVKDNYIRLPNEWNHFPSQEIIEDPAIVHFIGPAKPWHDKAHPFADEWRSLVDAAPDRSHPERIRGSSVLAPLQAQIPNLCALALLAGI